jgi:hypothetical protein
LEIREEVAADELAGNAGHHADRTFSISAVDFNLDVIIAFIDAKIRSEMDSGKESPAGHHVDQ